jgi:hypothetical protein
MILGDTYIKPNNTRESTHLHLRSGNHSTGLRQFSDTKVSSERSYTVRVRPARPTTPFAPELNQPKQDLRETISSVRP